MTDTEVGIDGGEGDAILKGIIPDTSHSRWDKDGSNGTCHEATVRYGNHMVMIE